jgi:hypothetical protein
MKLGTPLNQTHDFPGKMTPSAKVDRLLAKCAVFPGDFKALRQLSELAERGDSFILCCTVMLFWPFANGKLGGLPQKLLNKHLCQSHSYNNASIEAHGFGFVASEDHSWA